jgi:hypothetical protein
LLSINAPTFPPGLPVTLINSGFASLGPIEAIELPQLPGSSPDMAPPLPDRPVPIFTAQLNFLDTK